MAADGVGNPIKYVVLSNDNFASYEIFTYGGSDILTTSIPWNVPPGPGTKTVYIKVFNPYGSESVAKTVSGYLAGQDTEAPIITSWKVGDGATSGRNATETIIIDGVKENVTLASNLKYRISKDGGTTFLSYNGTSWVSGWSTDFRTTLPNFPLDLGQNALVLQIKDEANNIGSSMMIYTRVDVTTEPTTDNSVSNPTPSTLNGVRENLDGKIITVGTYNAQVSQQGTTDLSFTNLQNATKIYYSFDGISFSQPFSIPTGSTSYGIPLPFQKEGLQPAFFYLEDSSGAKSSIMKRMFLVDTELPQIISVSAKNFRNASTSAQLTLQLKDNVSTKFYYQYDTGSGPSTWNSVPTNGSINVPLTASVQAITVSVADEAGNVANETVSRDKFSDTQAPVFNSLKTLNGASATRDPSIDIIVDVKDDVSTTLQYSLDRGVTWNTLASDGIINVPISSTVGLKTIVVTIRDEAGNKSSKHIGIWKL